MFLTVNSLKRLLLCLFFLLLQPSQELQEENALKHYNEALLEQKNGNLEKAEEIYKQLLASNLLLKVI